MDGPEIKHIWIGEWYGEWNEHANDNVGARPHIGQDSKGRYYSALEISYEKEGVDILGNWRGPFQSRENARDDAAAELRSWTGEEHNLDYPSARQDVYPEIRGEDLRSEAHTHAMEALKQEIEKAQNPTRSSEASSNPREALEKHIENPSHGTHEHNQETNRSHDIER
jgi:hypothetical protein